MRDLSRLSRSGITAGLIAATLTLAGGAAAFASPVTSSAKSQGGAGGIARGPASAHLMAEFTSAAKQFQVPVNLLLAVGYNQSRWEPHGSSPSAGLASVPVYGSAYPEASAYPPGVPVQGNSPLAYTFPAGQSYVAIGLVPDDYYNAITFDSSTPFDHTVIHGTTQYYEIVYNHRLYYVNAADVQLEHLR